MQLSGPRGAPRAPRQRQQAQRPPSAPPAACRPQQRQRARGSLLTEPCRSASAQTAGLQLLQDSSLSTYQLRSSAGAALPAAAGAGGSRSAAWSQMWFEAMVQTVVKQLDGQPFLLRVGTRPSLRLELVRLDAGNLALGWAHVRRTHLAAARGGDDAVIFVHPVASEQQPCVVSEMQGGPCAGCPHTPAHGGAAAATELLQGHFGDCCGGEHAAPAGSSASDHRQQQVRQHHGGGDTQTSVYGLVVQCSDQADPLQGCYLLKTARVAQASGGGGGCHCTHYSLNRVCQGPPLAQQYQEAWLA